MEVMLEPQEVWRGVTLRRIDTLHVFADSQLLGRQHRRLFSILGAIEGDNVDVGSIMWSCVILHRGFKV